MLASRCRGDGARVRGVAFRMSKFHRRVQSYRLRNGNHRKPASMHPAYKYCLMSFLVTLPITVPFVLEGIYYEYDLDLYFELCIQRLFDGGRPLYCGFKPSYPPRAIVALIVMTSVLSVPLMPFAFPIVYAAAKLRSWLQEGRNDDAPPSGLDTPTA